MPYYVETGHSRPLLGQVNALGAGCWQSKGPSGPPQVGHYFGNSPTPWVLQYTNVPNAKVQNKPDSGVHSMDKASKTLADLTMESPCKGIRESKQ
jgi:hypothetical protein